MFGALTIESGISSRLSALGTFKWAEEPTSEQQGRVRGPVSSAELTAPTQDLLPMKEPFQVSLNPSPSRAAGSFLIADFSLYPYRPPLSPLLTARWQNPALRLQDTSGNADLVAFLVQGPSEKTWESADALHSALPWTACSRGTFIASEKGKVYSIEVHMAEERSCVLMTRHSLAMLCDLKGFCLHRFILWHWCIL